MTVPRADRAGARLGVVDQTGDLWQQVQAIGTLPRTRRRRFLRYEITCGRCGEPLLRWLKTSPQECLLVHAEPPPTRTLVVSAKGRSSESQRRGAAVLVLVNQDEQDDTREILAICSCQQLRRPLWMLYDAVRRGEARHVAHPDTLS